MNELDTARRTINEIDEQITSLFQRRMEAVRQIAAYKKENGLPIRDPVRESALLDRCRRLVTLPGVEGYLVDVMNKIMDVSCSWQESLISGRKVAYSGIEGAYAHIAARALFPEARYEGFHGFEAAYRAVENGQVDCAVLPLENSSAGEVGTVLDLIFSGSLYINQVYNMSIRHALMALPGAQLSDIRTVYSHPQALSQCSELIRQHDWTTVECENTAVAARKIVEAGDASVAALASPETGTLYGLCPLEDHISNAETNTTRFAVFSRSQNHPPRSSSKSGASFILVFTVENKAGALAQALNMIGAHGYNMKAVRSRPMKGLPWNYYFYMEVDGNITNENGEMLLRELSVVCDRLKLVGILS